MFKPRFSPLVQSGAKRQTIRPLRKRPIKPGDALSLREWTGLPYRSPQRILRDGEVCRSVDPIWIGNAGTQFNPGYAAFIGKTMLQGPEYTEFAIADGFKHWSDMFEWFAKTHGFPFNGTLIKW